MWTIFSLYWICYHIVSVLRFGFLAMRHVGSWLPYQGSNPHPLHWKVKSSLWTAKEVLFFFLNSFSISVLGAKFCGMWFGKCHFTEHLHVHLLIDPWNRQVLLYWFLRCGNCGSQRFDHLPRVTQLSSEWGQIQVQLSARCLSWCRIFGKLDTGDMRRHGQAQIQPGDL